MFSSTKNHTSTQEGPVYTLVDPKCFMGQDLKKAGGPTSFRSSAKSNMTSLEIYLYQLVAHG